MVDAVSVQTVPWRTLDGSDPHAWKAALERLAALDFEILAPGHGPLEHFELNIEGVYNGLTRR